VQVADPSAPVLLRLCVHSASAVYPGLLFLRLRSERAPIVGDGFSETVFEVWQNDGHPVANHGR
jgi:hypothetical protein